MLGGASETASCLLDKSKRHDFPNPRADSVVVDAVLAKVGVSDRQLARFPFRRAWRARSRCGQAHGAGQAQHAQGGRAQHLDRAHGELAMIVRRLLMRHASAHRRSCGDAPMIDTQPSARSARRCAPRRPACRIFPCTCAPPIQACNRARSRSRSTSHANARAPPGCRRCLSRGAIDRRGRAHRRGTAPGAAAAVEGSRSESTPHRRRGRRRTASIRAGAMRDVHIAF